MSYYVFLIFFLGSIGHYVYQSMIAPSLRDVLRASLRQLGRQLRLLEAGSPASSPGFGDLHESHERLLDALDRISLVALLEVDRDLRGNPALRQQVTARSAFFDRPGLGELGHIRTRTLRIAMQAIAVNNGGAIFWILPVMPFLLASAKFRAWLLRLTVQAIDLHQQLGPAYFGVKHDVASL
jgi:hypothetical protein